MSPEELKDVLLEKRGITDEIRQKFLYPSYDDLSDPFGLHDMEKAVHRILDAIEENEKIAVYADYDADGIPGAVVLHDFFRKIGYDNFVVYIPHRHTEGYGLHADAVGNLQKEGVTLIITVDVGTVAHEGVAAARDYSIDVVVCDHHEPVGELPPAYALVNPKLNGYPDPMLCGAAVSFRLVQALVARLPLEKRPVPGWEKWLLDMVGIATLSDMVPLVGENRIFAAFGLRVLQKSNRPGLKALLRRARVRQDVLTEEDVVFSITPRLNVASRMSDPKEAFEVLTTTDQVRADELAEHLALLTDERKSETARIMKSVHAKLQTRDYGNVVVVGDPQWNHGVLGLVASKVCDEYGKTCFVWSSDGDTIRGSCRAKGTTSVVKLMERAKDSFTQFGGHDGAGGFTTTRDHIHTLARVLDEVFQKSNFSNESSEEELGHDIELGLDDVTEEHYRAIRELAPFGQGNASPYFCFKQGVIEGMKQFGKKPEHLEIVFSQNGTRKKGISFFTTPDTYEKPVKEGQTRDIIASFDMSYFRNIPDLRLRIIDIV